MDIVLRQHKNSKVAIIQSDSIVISDVQTAMDLMANIFYHDDCQKILIGKENICPEFFDLRTRLAGEILQKYTNYHMRISIVGDFSTVSKSLADFIRECNKGQQVFFAATQQEALEWLHGGE